MIIAERLTASDANLNSQGEVLLFAFSLLRLNSKVQTLLIQASLYEVVN